MKTQDKATLEAWEEEILQNREKFIQDIKNSPAVLRKRREAIAQLSMLKQPFPWDENYLKKTTADKDSNQ